MNPANGKYVLTLAGVSGTTNAILLESGRGLYDGWSDQTGYCRAWICQMEGAVAGKSTFPLERSMRRERERV